MAASTWPASAGVLVTISPGRGSPAACTTPLIGPDGGAQFGHRPPGLLLVGDVGAQHDDAGAEVLDAPQPQDTDAGGVVVAVGGEPFVPCGGGGERGAAQEAEHGTGGVAREVFGEGEADAAEAAGDEVDAAVAQPGAVGVQGDPVEVPAPPVAPAQGEFGFVGGAGERGEHGADDAVRAGGPGSAPVMSRERQVMSAVSCGITVHAPSRRDCSG